MSHPQMHLQRVGSPDTEDNDRVRHPRTGNDRNQKDTDENGILKKMRSSVICSFRICSFSWSAQGNRWWEELRWSHRYANHEQIRDERLVEISTLLIHSAPKQKSNQWTHLSPFYTRIHGEWLRYAKSTSQFHWRFLLVRDDRGFQVNPLCRHDITRSDRQIWNSHSLVRYTSLLILKILYFLISS